ncbi:MAG: acylphosphatase, partial [Actinobacteria bacterium]|nr:acylphosphatase [Actinomycetota bacterium]
VQGVFFRETVRRRALAGKVAGYVRNRPDGSVEAVFEGERDAVERASRFASARPTMQSSNNGRGGGAGAADCPGCRTGKRSSAKRWFLLRRYLGGWNGEELTPETRLIAVASA